MFWHLPAFVNPLKRSASFTDAEFLAYLERIHEHQSTGTKYSKAKSKRTDEFLVRHKSKLAARRPVQASFVEPDAAPHSLYRKSRRGRRKRSHSAKTSTPTNSTTGLPELVRKVQLPRVKQDLLKLEQKEFSELELASDILKVVSKFTSETKRDLSQVTEHDVLSMILNSIEHVLNVPFAYRAFLAFAISEYSDEAVRFYKEVSDSSLRHRGIIPLAVAKGIFKNFIMEYARDQVNLSGIMREDIRNALEKAEKTGKFVDVAVFDAAMNEAKCLLEDQTFQRFKQKITDSKDYAEIVWSDGITTLHDFEVKNGSSIPLYRFFRDISVGLARLNSLIYQTKQNLSVYSMSTAAKKPYGKFPEGIGYQSEVFPAKLRELRDCDY